MCVESVLKGLDFLPKETHSQPYFNQPKKRKQRKKKEEDWRENTHPNTHPKQNLTIIINNYFKALFSNQS